MVAGDGSGGVGVGGTCVIGTAAVAAPLAASAGAGGAPPSKLARALDGGRQAAQVIGAAATGTKSGSAEVPIRRVRSSGTAKASAAGADADPPPEAGGLDGRVPDSGARSTGASRGNQAETETRAPMGASLASPGTVAAGASGCNGGYKKRRAADALGGSGVDAFPPAGGNGKGTAPGRACQVKAAATACGPPYNGRAGGGVGFSYGVSGKANSAVVRGTGTGREAGEFGGQQRRLHSSTGRSRLAVPAATVRSVGGGGGSGGCSGGARASPSGSRGGRDGAGPSGMSSKPDGLRNKGRRICEIDLTVCPCRVKACAATCEVVE